MRLSSSPSDEPLGLFDGVLGRGPVAGAVSDRAWLRALLDVEAALARAGAAAGLVPAGAADAITAACADASRYDVSLLGQQAATSGNPVVGLARRIEEVVGPQAGPHVHRGATSQDVLDTAMLLVARRAIVLLLEDLSTSAEAAALLAARHRDTAVAGRTLLQQALPTTFGLKAAGWMLGLGGAEDRLRGVVEQLPVQMFGAVGTHSAFEGHGPAVVNSLAEELGLQAPVLSWHTLRLPVADLAGALGTTAGILGKIGLDLVLLAQTEVAEIAEGAPGRGGSSTMPHKNNPVAAISARAAAARAPGLVSTLLAGMPQEHERAAGAWQAEWETLSLLLRTVGSAATWLRDALEHLHVDPVRMQSNLSAGAAALAAEAVAGRLAPVLGRSTAHDLVARAVDRAAQLGADLTEVLLAEPELAPHLQDVDLAAVMATAGACPTAPQMVDRALQAHRARGVAT